MPIFLKISALIAGLILSIIFFMNYLKKGAMRERRINYLKKKEVSNDT